MDRVPQPPALPSAAGGSHGQTSHHSVRFVQHWIFEQCLLRCFTIMDAVVFAACLNGSTLVPCTQLSDDTFLNTSVLIQAQMIPYRRVELLAMQLRHFCCQPNNSASTVVSAHVSSVFVTEVVHAHSKCNCGRVSLLARHCLPCLCRAPFPVRPACLADSIPVY
jgi:hypothetical protein